MKKLSILITTMICMLFAQHTYAGNWTRTTIDTIQVASKGLAIYVVVNDPINFPGCETTKSLHFLNNDTSASFDEIFAMLMLAKAQDTEISILTTGVAGGGECNSTGSVVREPLIRFH